MATDNNNYNPMANPQEAIKLQKQLLDRVNQSELTDLKKAVGIFLTLVHKSIEDQDEVDDILAGVKSIASKHCSRALRKKEPAKVAS